MRGRIGIVALLLALLAGCGGSKSGSSSEAAKLFGSAGCSGCHTLSAANAHGQVGPNLDALKPDEATVARQVRVGGNGMPSFAKKLSKGQIDELARFVAQSSRQVPVSLAFRPDKTTIASCATATSQGCLRQAFGNIAYRDGPKKALALAQKDDLTMPSVHADCHQITHAIGHAGLAYYHGNPSAALAHGAMTCNSGYYHGVIELSFGGKTRDQVVHIARGLCTGAAVNKNDFLLYQCVHGLGHGLMIYSGDDLPFSLHACDKLQTSFDRVSCTGGVFMQNLMPGMVTSPYLRKNDPIYPCNVVAERYKLYCYLEVTSVILPYVNWNWAKAAAWCRKSDPGWVGTCFESLGRDASGASRYEPKTTLQYCLLAGSGTGSCIYGAARDYANNYAGGRQAVGLCEQAPARYRAHCMQGVGTILGALHQLGNERRAACAAVVPKAYLRDCLEGAGV